ncbi:hypothetical protein [Flavobacterium psychrotrophum]|uniref:hypothetical protein n=1 Tax=Flavobacterium psychrotrophum TaxID=2294119 RepID=UPI0013C4876D|nr:hypothetical protein [Flavobacterium psychrotrophum]
MEESKRTPHQQKIVDALAKVHDDLLAFKKRMNSPLVVMQGDQIVKIKPWLDEKIQVEK